ncbi:MAG TPA: signal recognition particle subunit SRP19/SEC65 family protein [Thermoplasmata archaeon]|nr:signal recognition particle subunit SRP19/SEC65 family protein [Thermoplasmata archaeon]
MPDYVYVYPSYLRKKSSRAVGRRVPAELGLAEVSAEQIHAAARKLGYKAEVEPAKLYPRQSQLFEGRVKITKKEGTSKTKLLRELAAAVRAAAPVAAGS